MRPSTDAWLRGIAGHGLPGADDRLGPPPRDREWPLQLDALTWHRLTGLALLALHEASIELTDEQSADLLARHRQWMDGTLLAERRLLHLAERFLDAGVEPIVLKGPAWAHGPYPDPALRPFGDIDLLVRDRDWDRALQALETAGARRQGPDPRRGFAARFGKAATHRCGDGLDIDLHRTIAQGPFGQWIDAAELADRSEAFELAGHPLRRLDPSTAFVHAAVHAALGTRPPVLLAIRDVAQLQDDPRLDWDLVIALARRWRLGAVLQHAVGLARTELATPLPQVPDQLLALPVPRIERLALTAYTTERRDRGGVALTTLVAIRGPRAKAAYLAALLVPRRAFVAARHGDRGTAGYLRRWRTLGRWTTGPRRARDDGGHER